MHSYRVHTELLQSEALDRRIGYRIALPEGQFAQLPLMVLLHGVHGSETDWTEKGGLAERLNELSAQGILSPMAVLTPSDGLTGIGTGYLDWIVGPPHSYQTYLMNELIPDAEKKFQAGGRRSLRSISGLSMGGFAAISLALRKPEQFAAASSLSGFFDVRDLARLIGRRHYAHVFDQDDARMDHVSPLTMKLPASEGLPYLRFDCGKDDRYAEENRKLHVRLEEASIPHDYYEYEGGHTWAYWRTHLAAHLAAHNRIFEQLNRMP